MIDPDALKVATTKILLESLTPEDREKLLGDALRHIISPDKPKDSWGKPGPSILQDAFERAVQHAAMLVVRDYFEQDEVKARVKAFVNEAIEKSLSDSNGFTSKLAERMINGIWREP